MTKPIHLSRFTRPMNRRTFGHAMLGQVAAIQALSMTGSADAETIAQFGAVGDGQTDAAGEINAAIDVVHAEGGGVVLLPAGTYRLETTVILKRGVYLLGVHQGAVTLKLKPGANCNILDSERFDDLLAARAYDFAQDSRFTQDYGCENLVLHGNRAEQGTKSLLYGVRWYGRRAQMRNCIITDVKGVGLFTEKLGGHTQPFDHSKTQVPAGIHNVQIMATDEEGWIVGGMADIAVDGVVTNLIGPRGKPVDGIAPTSSTFLGEEIHSIRVLSRSSFEAGMLNLNNARFGRGLYVEGGARVHVNNLIVAGCWGALKVEANALGSINSITSQANQRRWKRAGHNGTRAGHPHIHNLADDVQYDNVLIRRVGDQDTGDPAILEEGGAMWQSVKIRQGNRTDPGHGIVISGTGSQFLSVDIKGCGGTASDGAPSAAVLIRRGADLFLRARLANNLRGVVNEQANLDGDFDIVARFTSATDTVLEGFTRNPTIDGVTVNQGWLTKESLRKSRITLRDDGQEYYNGFSGLASPDWDVTTTKPQAATVAHGMWRTPDLDEVHLTLFCDGPSFPRIDYFLISAVDRETLTFNLKLGTSLVKSVTSKWGAKIN